MSVPVPVGDGQPATNVPATDLPTTNVPATDLPTTNVPATDLPATNVPATVLTNADHGAQPADRRRFRAVYPEPDAEPEPDM